MPKRKPNYFRIARIESRVFQGDLPKQSYGRFRHASQVAVDLEYQTAEQNVFDMTTTKLAAIQISSEGLGAVIVRVQNGEKPLYMLEILKNPKIQKVFHYAFGDCTLIRQHWGIRVENVVCTKIAAKLLSDDLSVSSSLVELLPKYIDERVSKEQQMSNWLAPTLTKEQIEYATKDVIYLCELLAKLVRELDSVGKLEMAQKIWASLPDIVEDEVNGVHQKNNWRDPIIQYK